MALHRPIDSHEADNHGISAWDAIRSRRNVRQYGPRPVEEADLDQILEAARRSPSSQNSQPWDFVLVTDRDQLTRLAGVWFGGKHVASSAATIALIARADDLARVQFDLGQATMSIMIVATSLGIGSCHSAVGDQDLARELLGHPPGTTCCLLISLGYPQAAPGAHRGPRPPPPHRPRPPRAVVAV